MLAGLPDAPAISRNLLNETEGWKDANDYTDSSRLARRSKSSHQRPDADCVGSLDLISELMGQSLRKNSDWLILGNVLSDLELVRSRADDPSTPTKE